MKEMRKILLYCFILLCSLNALAGKRIIKGQVLGEDGYPLPETSIVEKGTKNSVSTDLDGKFEIRVKNKKDNYLVVSFKECETKEVKLDKKEKFYTITLVDNAPSAELIINTGYISNQRRRGGYPDIKFSEEDLAREYRRIEERATEVPVDGKNKKK